MITIPLFLMIFLIQTSCFKSLFGFNVTLHCVNAQMPYGSVVRVFPINSPFILGQEQTPVHTGVNSSPFILGLKTPDHTGVKEILKTDGLFILGLIRTSRLFPRLLGIKEKLLEGK